MRIIKNVTIIFHDWIHTVCCCEHDTSQKSDDYYMRIAIELAKILKRLLLRLLLIIKQGKFWLEDLMPVKLIRLFMEKWLQSIIASKSIRR